MLSQKARLPAVSLVALTALNLLNYVDRYTLPAVASPLQRHFGIDDEHFARLTTAFMLGYFLTSPLFGYFGDRVSRKWLIAAGVVIWSIGTTASGIAGSFGVLICFRVLVGVGEASFGTLSPAWLADLYSPERRNQVLAIFYLAIPIGAAIAFKVGGWMASSHGWQSAFFLVGLPGVVLGLGVLGLQEPLRSSPPREQSTTAPRRKPDYTELLQFRPYLLVVAGYVGYTFAMGGFVIWAAPFLERVHGMPLKSADDFFGLAVVGTGLTATLLGGFLAGRWEKSRPGGTAILLSASAIAAVPAVFAAFLVPNLGAAKIALVCSMFLLFLSTGPVNTVIVGSVPATMRASAMAASIFAIHLFGDLWSPWIVGAVSDRMHSLQQAMLWTLPGAVVVCAFFWTWLAIRARRVPAEFTD